LRDENHLDDAVAEFEEVYQLDEREGRFELLRTLLQQGEALERANNEAGALAAYNRVLAISPREHTAQERKAALWEKKGDQSLKEGNLAAAIEAYRQAGADKKLADVKSQKLKAELEDASKEAKGYEAQEEWGGALDVYERLSKLDPDDTRWQQAQTRIESEKWLAERYAEGAGYIQQTEWLKAQKPLADVINRRPDYKDAAQLLALANQRGKGFVDETAAQGRRRYIYGGIAFIVVILVGVGIWVFSQSQFQNEAAQIAATATAAEQELATRLTTTAVAQATASDVDSATKVAVAVQGTQLAEVRGTQTAEARIIQTSEAATQVAEDRRTATAKAIADKTAQAPAATPTNTRTPRPTPIPAATIDSDPTVYDNFNNPANENSLNQTLWDQNDSFNSNITQQNETLVISHQPTSSESSTNLAARKRQSVSLEDFNFFEARLMLKDASSTGNVHMFISSDNLSWSSECLVHRYSSGISTSCFETKWPPPESGFEFNTDFIPTEFDRWHTVRIEVNPNTMEFSFLIDGQLIATHIPASAEQLKNDKFTLHVGTWGEDTVIGYVEDVRIGQIEQ
jgi:tetratricopeptide (TPR) repeat protein